MPLSEEFVLYSLADFFNRTLEVKMSKDTLAFIKNKSKDFSKLSTADKIYYFKYSVQLAESLMRYLDGICYFEINTDETNDIAHDFRLTWKKNKVVHISIYHNTINVHDVIPEKLMKICKYKRNTKVCKSYNENYRRINDMAYKKIKSKTKYTELSDKAKNKAFVSPVCDLVVTTLSKKRKCAAHLYNHLFSESNRIVIKLHKNRFVMYDFGQELGSVDSYRMKLSHDNHITITFNNKAKFVLNLQPNGPLIKEHLSIKFHTNFKNMDDIFAVDTQSV